MTLNVKSIVQHVIQIKNGICQFERKKYHKCKKDYSWNPSTCIYENSKYLKGIADTSVIECDEIITVMDIVSTKSKNTITTNNTSTASMNCHSKNVRYCYVITILFRCYN